MRYFTITLVAALILVPSAQARTLKHHRPSKAHKVHFTPAPGPTCGCPIGSGLGYVPIGTPAPTNAPS